MAGGFSRIDQYTYAASGEPDTPLIVIAPVFWFLKPTPPLWCCALAKTALGLTGPLIAFGDSAPADVVPPLANREWFDPNALDPEKATRHTTSPPAASRPVSFRSVNSILSPFLVDGRTEA